LEPPLSSDELQAAIPATEMAAAIAIASPRTRRICRPSTVTS
jgi:hypothetical protein